MTTNIEKARVKRMIVRLFKVKVCKSAKKPRTNRRQCPFIDMSTDQHAGMEAIH
mgnify:CR=1 FL=1